MRRALPVALLVVAAWTVAPAPAARSQGQVTVRAAVERHDDAGAGGGRASRGNIGQEGPMQVVPPSLVAGLSAADFEILSDGQARPIESFSTDDAPVAIVVLLDVSASTEINVEWLLEPLQKNLIPALKPGDRLAFGRFGGIGLAFSDRFPGDSREMVTAARDLLSPRARRAASASPAVSDVLTRSAAVTPTPPEPTLHVESYLNGAFGLGPSAVWDAVDAAVTLLETQRGRRAILVVTDGRSTGNVHSLDDAIVHAVAEDVSVSIVGEASEERIPQAQAGWAVVRPGVFVKAMADNSGGAYAEVFGAPAWPWPIRFDEAAVKRALGGILSRLVADLHQTYTLSFAPPVLDGKLHQLEVRVKTPGLRVRAKRGYLAPSREL